MMKAFCWGVALLLLSSAVFAGDDINGGVYKIGDGFEVTCNQLFNFKFYRVNGTVYAFERDVASITNEDVVRLLAGVSSCYRNEISKADKSNGSLGMLEQHENFIKMAQFKQAYESASENIKSISRMRQEKIDKEKLAAQEICQSKNPYLIYRAQRDVLNQSILLDDVKMRMAYERRVSRIGGVRDLAAERENAEYYALYLDGLKKSWAKYRKLGGKESSPSRITNVLNDPCEIAYPGK
ncbi:hypothetical protein PWG14_02525 (plasmid) [Chromobacterium amazonense]|uniref:hypothetical protein n=1 Tax=Chromobacterium amazonense TaxID=1382803 RepID=UPI00237E4258|nr:hypothetical protein [Chromobacterium amazonense]MDE1711662.1 hypothetical protein [Chromobacterium amazonense]